MSHSFPLTWSKSGNSVRGNNLTIREQNILEAITVLDFGVGTSEDLDVAEVAVNTSEGGAREDLAQGLVGTVIGTSISVATAGGLSSGLSEKGTAGYFFRNRISS